MAEFRPQGTAQAPWGWKLSAGWAFGDEPNALTSPQKLRVFADRLRGCLCSGTSAKKAAADAANRMQSHDNGRAPEADIAKAAQAHEAALDLQMARYRAYESREQLVTRCAPGSKACPRRAPS